MWNSLEQTNLFLVGVCYYRILYIRVPEYRRTFKILPFWEYFQHLGILLILVGQCIISFSGVFYLCNQQSDQFLPVKKVTGNQKWWSNKTLYRIVLDFGTVIFSFYLLNPIPSRTSDFISSQSIQISCNFTAVVVFCNCLNLLRIDVYSLKQHCF